MSQTECDHKTLAILIFAEKGAPPEFNMNHPLEAIIVFGLVVKQVLLPRPLFSTVVQVASSGVARRRSKENAKANKNRTDRMDGYG